MDEIINLTSGLLYSILEVQELDDSYIVITLNPQNNMFRNALTRIHSSILIFILIECLLSIVTSKRMIKPMEDLTVAT